VPIEAAARQTCFGHDRPMVTSAQPLPALVCCAGFARGFPPVLGL